MTEQKHRDTQRPREQCWLRRPDRPDQQGWPPAPGLATWTFPVENARQIFGQFFLVGLSVLLLRDRCSFFLDED